MEENPDLQSEISDGINELTKHLPARDSRRYRDKLISSKGDSDKLEKLKGEVSGLLDKIDKEKQRIGRVQSRFDFQRGTIFPEGRKFAASSSKSANEGADGVMPVFGEAPGEVDEVTLLSHEIKAASSSSEPSKTGVQKLMDRFSLPKEYSEQQFTEDFGFILVGLIYELNEKELIGQMAFIDQLYTEAHHSDPMDIDTIRTINNAIAVFVQYCPNTAEGLIKKLPDDSKLAKSVRKKLPVKAASSSEPPRTSVIPKKYKDDKGSCLKECESQKLSRFDYKRGKIEEQTADDISRIAMNHLSAIPLELFANDTKAAIKLAGFSQKSISLTIVNDILTRTEGKTVSQDSVTKKVAFYIGVAEKCLDKGDIHSFMSIMAAINSSTLQRAVEALPEREKKRYDALVEITRESRLDLRKREGLTPYMGSYGGSYDGISTKISSYDSENKLNVSKFVNLGRLAAEWGNKCHEGQMKIGSQPSHFSSDFPLMLESLPNIAAVPTFELMEHFVSPTEELTKDTFVEKYEESKQKFEEKETEYWETCKSIFPQ